MKNTTNIILALGVLVLAIGLFQDHALEVNMSEHKENTITITGTAEKEVVPDTARISFSVNEYKTTQKEAANIVNTKVKNIVDALEDLDINDKDIKTHNYSVYPQYDWNNGKRVFRNYKVSQSVEVLVRELDTVSKVLAKVVELKVDNLNGPNMFVDELDQIKDSLRGEAIDDAKKKAKELASELGVDLDKLIGFSESNNNGYYPQPMYKTMAMDGVVMEESVVEPEINPGQEKITKTVSLTFQIQ